jgi:hypothetical protein
MKLKEKCPRERLRSRWKQRLTKHVTLEQEKHMAKSRESSALGRYRHPAITQQA